jgi:hypothetical protein
MSGVSQLYAFSNFTFTSCGATGSNGPTITQVYNTYTGVSWSNYITVSGTRPGVQLWRPPASTVYYFEVAGCCGVVNPAVSTGAIMRGDVFLDKTKQYQILIGQSGQSGSGLASGSGGTFLVDSNDTPIIVAGGGGGNRLGSNASCASVTTTGVTGIAPGVAGNVGGTNGQGGSGASAGGGGGFTSDGNVWTGGKAFLNGGIGGSSSNNPAAGVCDFRARNGGFGGGGGINTGCAFICGGGGGYSGGGAAQSASAAGNSGGGGGSYSIATAQSNTSLADGNSNLGYIKVQYSSVPLTGTISLLNLGQRIGISSNININNLYNKYNSGPTIGMVGFSNFRGLRVKLV